MIKKISIVGARGYVAEELIKIILRHNEFKLGFIGSHSHGGELVDEIFPALAGQNIKFENIQPENIKNFSSEIYVLAVPNGIAKKYVKALKNTPCKIIDLSYDMRFDNEWVYGLTEKNRKLIRAASKVSNPGCYATGAQLGLAPLLEKLAENPVIFGVSGYSGTGRTPSDKNNPKYLYENFLPYQMTEHGHEVEISHHLGRDVNFIPHVAPHFRGISLTIHFRLKSQLSASKLLSLFKHYYAQEVLIKVSVSIPEVQKTAHTPNVNIGGFKMSKRDPNRGVFVVTLDNLLKGAASQAMQNINLMFNMPELNGIVE